MTRRLTALVIGNAKYPDDPLKNPTNDADDISAKLRSHGFDVLLGKDCTNKEMDKLLKEFRAELAKNDVGLFFFAGHGMQIDGINYLLAVDTDMEAEEDAKHSSLSLDKVVGSMAKSSAATRIVVLDACRNNPWERRWHRGAAVRGLASVYAPKGTIIAFATSPGEVALDGVGKNGTYTAALLQHIDTPDCSIESMFKRVRNEVAAASGNKQTSWEHTSLSGDFYFNLGISALVAEYGSAALADELLILDTAKHSHRIIKELKSRNWHIQNPAVEKLTAASVEKMAKDNLFVLGRNIYQAACGSAFAARTFIHDFGDVASDYPADKRKFLLDGMLFEVFFDKKGRLREEFKSDYFEELFALQKHRELKASFDFIANALTSAKAKFYSLPGKGHELAVTVAIKEKGEAYVVTGVFINSANVLRSGDDARDKEDGEPRYRPLSQSDLEQDLSKNLVVPMRLLRITYTPAPPSDAADIKFPWGWTIRCR